MHVDWAETGRDALDVALARAPVHFTYFLRAARDEGCAYVFVAQGPGRFDVLVDRPAIVLLGDDVHTALGPRGFHERSLRRVLTRARAVAIVACEPLVLVSREAASSAVLKRGDVVIIETLPEREAEWLAAVCASAPADRCKDDRSLSVTLSASSPDGFVGHSHSTSSEWCECRDYVADALGLGRDRL